MEEVFKILSYAFKMVVFVVATVIFAPAFLITTYLQEPWAKMLEELFNY